MNIITSKPIIVAGSQNDDYSNLKGGDPKEDILAFQNWAVSKGYIQNEMANGKWNVDTDKAYDNYGKVYESEKGGKFRFDLLPSIKSLTETKTGYPSAGDGKTLPTLEANAERPKSENKGIGLWGWVGIGAGVLVLGVIAYKISKYKNN
jgi:hypothetical protein